LNESRDQSKHSNNSSGSNKSIESGKKQKQSNNNSELTYNWFGSNALVRVIYDMSWKQHEFYLNRRPSKETHIDLRRLEKKITESSKSIVEKMKLSRQNTPTMTRKPAHGVYESEVEGKKGKTPEIQAAEVEIMTALKTRRRDLEDRLYEKVQDLKKLCLEESAFTGKLPAELIRYLDLNEKVPLPRRRIGAEYKIKPHGKEMSSTVTAASSYSSGFVSDTNENITSELNNVECEAKILQQICSASEVLYKNKSTLRKLRDLRRKVHKSNVKKLKNTEERIDELRKKVGIKPAERASLLFADDFDYTSYDDKEDVKVKHPNGSLISSDSLSADGNLFFTFYHCTHVFDTFSALTNEDTTSLSSSGDTYSTRSTPATINKSNHYSVQSKQHPASVLTERRRNGNNLLKDGRIKRSLTPSPTFRGTLTSSSSSKFIPAALASSNLNDKRNLQASPLKASHHLLDHPNSFQTKRNWTARKWEHPKTERGWKESSLDTTVPSSTKLNNESTKGKLEKSIKQNENTSMSRDKRSYSDVTLKRQQHIDEEQALSHLSITGSDTASSTAPRSTTPNTIMSSQGSPAASIHSSTDVTRRSSSFDDVTTIQEHPSQILEASGGNVKLTNHPPQPQPPPHQTDYYHQTQVFQRLPTGVRMYPIMYEDNPANIRNHYLSSNESSQAYITRDDLRASYQRQMFASPYNHMYTRYSSETPPYSPSNCSVFTQNFDSIDKHGRDDSDLESNVDWAPSLHEYSNRASLAESCSSKQKKETLITYLEEHIAMKQASEMQSRNNMMSSSKHQETQRRNRDDQRVNKTNPTRLQISGEPSSWVDYQQRKQKHTAGVSYHQPQLYQYNTNQPPVLYQTQRRIATTNHNKAVPANYYPINLVGRTVNRVPAHISSPAYVTDTGTWQEPSYAHQHEVHRRLLENEHHHRMQASIYPQPTNHFPASATNVDSFQHIEDNDHYSIVGSSKNRNNHSYYLPVASGVASSNSSVSGSTLQRRSNTPVNSEDHSSERIQQNNYLSSPYLARRSMTTHDVNEEQLHYPIHNYPYQQIGRDYQTTDHQRPYRRRQAASADDLLVRGSNEDTNEVQLGTLV